MLPSALLVGVTTMLSPWVTVVLAAAAAAFTSPIFAALVAVSPPLATLVMGLLPASMPSPLMVTGPAVMLVKPVRVLFSSTLRPSEPAVVVMLLSPFTAKVSPSFFASVVELLSPVKVKPLLAISSDAVTPLAISSLVLSDKSTA